MIDVKRLREDPEPYKLSASKRGLSVEFEHLLKLDAERGPLIARVDGLRAKLKTKGKPTAEQLKELQHAKSQLEPLESRLTKLESEYAAELAKVPNLLAPGTPDGGEEANAEEERWGEAHRSKLAGHLELAEANDWVDFERGAKVAGAKFYFLKGAAVRLELALVQMISRTLEEAGFTLMGVPHLASTRIMSGTGFNPRGGDEKQIYEVTDADLNLIATAEIPLTGYHADEIIDPEHLPLLYAGYSPAYRQEAGAYGRHSKGLYRVHQFNKLEMYVFCQPADSEEWHQKLVQLEEAIVRQLEIPYRRVRIAAGDLGAPAYKKYDLEYWSPVEGAYRELTSCSNVTDYQARRLQIRTRDAHGNIVHVHTLNGTAMAFSRTFIALLENHQTPEGTVRIPQALQSYYGRETL